MIEVASVSNFETNPGSFRAGKNAGAAPPTGGKLGANPAAFREFMDKRKAAKAGASPAVKAKAKAAPALPMKPTAERMAKTDKPRKTGSGAYRAPHPLERLRDQGKLDPNPRVNLAMFEAAEKLYTHFYQGGLKGIQAQDLSRASGSGDGGACQFPASENAMFHRGKFREATRIMGWHVDSPYRGAGRLVVDVVCYEMPVLEAGRIHTPPARTDTIAAKGMEKLCEGLFILAAHWRLF